MAITPSVLFVILTGIILGLIGIVVFLERFVAKKKEVNLQDPAYEYTAQLKALKRESLEPVELLNRIDALARKALNPTTTGAHLDYSQLAETYKDKPHIAQFCEAMTESLYAGQKITPLQTKTLLHTLEDMLKGEGKLILIQPKEEKLEAKQGFFLDHIIEKVALRVNDKLQTIKQEEAKAEQVVEQSMPKEASLAEFKKEKYALPQNKTAQHKKDRQEYHFIESIDVLDRIEKKLSTKRNLAKSS